MRLIDVDGTYGVMASDNTDWTCTFSGGIITVADEAGFIHAEFLVDDIPSVDAVPVVRCQDCENSYYVVDGLICAYGPCVDCPVSPDFWCANGKRREDDHAQD
nr:MAG TPA: hypothetical protein [Caudoviricetes sp.]DAI29683.1 MAG TPA: hypothetical protein [Caudoviricetes sp.]